MGRVYPEDRLVDRDCPSCGQLSLYIVWRLEAKPIGTFSLSGVTPKVVGTKHPYLVCKSCGVQARGTYEEGD